ncbi:DUF6221 family protein [Pseudarthrobacter chlorophenolicus]|uniref:DUF6221 family protein n=1 Tax=Pseudarthrobacter chlorophenolicus TaxID=85085 RepID=UPI00389B2CCD
MELGWQKGRMAAECAAKRQILAVHTTPTYTVDDPAFPIEPAACSCGRLPCPTLRALAAIYADHPDYQSTH